jgi:hypothetical protein
MPLGLLGIRTLFVVLYYKMNATVRELNLFHSSDETVEKHIQEGLSITAPLFPCGWPPRCLRKSLVRLAKVVYMQTVGRDSSVGIGIRYGLDGGARFPESVQTGRGAHPASHKMGTWSHLGVKRSVCGVNYPLRSTAEVKERVELYLYSSMGLRGLFQGEFYLYMQTMDGVSKIFSKETWLVISWNWPVVVQSAHIKCHQIRKKKIFD